MNDKLRARREETYRMLVAHGRPQAEVIARLSDEYGVTKNAIRQDIKQMTEWLPDLSVDFGAGIVRLTRLRDQQQELELLAMKAERDENYNAAVGARREIRKAIMAEEQIASRMGLAPEGEADENAWEKEVQSNISRVEEALLDEFCGLDHDPYWYEDGTLMMEDEDGNVWDEDDNLVHEAGGD
ncbi:hypothetical protein [Halegenticoccus soli]|uniref:hypothetical protein n=1 Tax=Halegenticoccus soli TaxID=1985678 RepID=UPI000C6D0829|nr:hypothetical protein [Halegenticoccus soli]